MSAIDHPRERSSVEVCALCLSVLSSAGAIGLRSCHVSSLRDWADDTTPGGPVGQETFVRFSEIQPYLGD